MGEQGKNQDQVDSRILGPPARIGQKLAWLNTRSGSHWTPVIFLPTDGNKLFLDYRYISFPGILILMVQT